MGATDELKNRTRYCDTCKSELEWEDHFALSTTEEWLRFCNWECLTEYGANRTDQQ